SAGELLPRQREEDFADLVRDPDEGFHPGPRSEDPADRQGRLSRRSIHRYGDLFRYQRRAEYLVFGVTEHELQRVAARRQIDARLALPGAEMNMILVGWEDVASLDLIVEIDEQMMVS